MTTKWSRAVVAATALMLGACGSSDPTDPLPEPLPGERTEREVVSVPGPRGTVPIEINKGVADPRF